MRRKDLLFGNRQSLKEVCEAGLLLAIDSKDTESSEGSNSPEEPESGKDEGLLSTEALIYRSARIQQIA
jgi:hypothetical protein